MKSTFVFGLGIVIILILLVYSLTYQVRFDEVALVTRFGKKIAIRDGTDQAGLYFKLPPPFDVVRRYDKRVKILEDRPEEQQTLDDVSVVVQTFLAWRIVNPLQFREALGSVDEAEKQLRSKLRDARRVIGEDYTFEDLTNTHPQRLRLAELEEAILQKMRTELTEARQPYGVELVAVGIKRILLAPRTTEEVFNRMKSTRQRMAASYREEGEARAQQIKAEAEGMRNVILSFAEARAAEIRGEGETAAATHLKVFDQDQEFAIYLRMLDAYKKIFAETSKGKTTLIIDAENNPLFRNLTMPNMFGAPDGPLRAAAPEDRPPASVDLEDIDLEEFETGLR